MYGPTTALISTSTVANEIYNTGKSCHKETLTCSSYNIQDIADLCNKNNSRHVILYSFTYSALNYT